MSFTQDEALTFNKSDTLRGVSIFLVDVVALVLLAYAAVSFSAWWLQALFSIATGIMIGVLFVVGHDAAHNSLTPSRRLNHVLGQLSLFPALHSFSNWVLVHNQTHHRWTNLSPRDYVWTPLDAQQFQNLSRGKQRLYRFYRGPLGPLLYYFHEFWWKRMFFPSKQAVPKYKTAYFVDNLLVVAFACTYLAFLYLGGQAGWLSDPAQPYWRTMLFGAVIPFFVWNTLMGFVIYLHHTHPQIRWYNDEELWKRNSPQIESSVHVIFPGPINRMFHWIMEHNAHHVRPSIPLYRLREAQQAIERHTEGRIIMFHWSLRSHFQVTRKCKLYDFDQQRWTDFSGNYTS